MSEAITIDHVTFKCVYSLLKSLGEMREEDIKI